MPRGERYPDEMREEARRLRRQGLSLGEISARLGPPKNTLTLWVRDIELSLEQQEQIHEREIEANGLNRALASQAHREARLERIALAHVKAEQFFAQVDNFTQISHVAAAMLYLGEGAKADGQFCFGNSNPEVIRYWMYLLRSSFELDEAKFCIQLRLRFDQDVAAMQQYWTEVTGIRRHIKPAVDPRTERKPTQREGYMGVCGVHYYDVSIRRYLDAVAAGLMARAQTSS
jgi:hypothetical protein